MSPQPAPNSVLQLFFFFLMLLPFVVLIRKVAIRKGRSGLLALWGFVPLANMFVAMWIVSLTDAAVLLEIENLKKRLNSQWENK